MDDVTVVVLIYQEYEHKRGRRYKRNSPMACMFGSIGEAMMRVEKLKELANPDPAQRLWGAWPCTYEWAMYRLQGRGGGEYAIRSGTTEFEIREA